MAVFLSNVLTDTSNPWYYVSGVLALIVVFGAVAAYIYFSGKKSGGDVDGRSVENVVEPDPTPEPVGDAKADAPSPERND